MARITRNRFVAMMDEFAAAHDTSRKIDKMLEEDLIMRSSLDFFSSACFHLPSESIALELLGIMLDDRDDIIEYWACERNFGRDWRPGDLTVKGEDVDLSDAGKLYDYLTTGGGDLPSGRCSPTDDAPR